MPIVQHSPRSVAGRRPNLFLCRALCSGVGLETLGRHYPAYNWCLTRFTFAGYAKASPLRVLWTQAPTPNSSGLRYLLVEPLQTVFAASFNLVVEHVGLRVLAGYGRLFG